MATSGRTATLNFNGATDGTGVNRALTSLGGPGAVQLPNGNGVVDVPILLGSGQTLLCEGVGATTLTAKAGLNADMITNIDQVGGNPECGVIGLTVNGNKAAQAGTNNHHGIYFVRCANGIVDRCEVYGVDGHGITLDGQGTVTRDSQLTNIIVHDNSQVGLWETFAMRNTQTANVQAYNNGSHGVEFDSSEERVTNIDSRNNTGRGIFIRNVFGSVYNNLATSQNGTDGIYVQGMTSSLGNNWLSYSNSVTVAAAAQEINFSGDNTLSYGITSGSIVRNIIAGPAGGLGNTAGYALFIGDPTSGNFGDLKIGDAFLTAGVTGQIRTPASPGGLIIEDFPGATSNRRWWAGGGLATPNGFQLGTAAAQKIAFYGKAAIVQPAKPTAPAATGSTNAAPFGYTTAAQADAIQAAVNSIITLLSNLGLTA